jgi:hypothetical protein
MSNQQSAISSKDIKNKQQSISYRSRLTLIKSAASIRLTSITRFSVVLGNSGPEPRGYDTRLRLPSPFRFEEISRVLRFLIFQTLRLC